MSRVKISKKATRLMLAFEESAKWLGWAEDQGTQAQVDQAQAEVNEISDKLRKYVTRLERALLRAAQGNAEKSEADRVHERDGGKF